MGLSDKDIALLEKFWFGNLPRKTRNEVVKRLQEDADFNREAIQLKQTIDGLYSLREQKVRTYLQEKENSLPQIELKSERYFGFKAKHWIVSALIIAIVISIIAYIKISGSASQPPAAIAQNYFRPYPYVGQTLSENDSIAQLYAKADYEAAIPSLENKFENENDTLTLFYLGIAYLGQNQATKATSVFESIQYSVEVPQDATQWYLALSYLQQDRISAAIPILESLTISEWKEKAKAKEILKKLESIKISN
ncbi:tetratricopeptide repeat protein [Flavilitoribacter nigricans]|uniref:Tetratricopeptide repeat protein n=1 Tax=Flavilitoribacter nigricans (strain ATCC 23147 / DSM 23189 / NBRC 102662 / NCIMB 1420 / SS-2) TaxID=1122177 RepID=A0A2D0MXJ8_FLAN2|nr:hypothetical protein [Flavilitoribacter nigricans]PHN00937.1 hypothetical protein CRP01_39775 [Flavilitoribacter nigricans DSM 23189 = NBRC 102662]